MKKLIVSGLVALMFFAPFSVTMASNTLSPLQVSIITQLIALLEQELQLSMTDTSTTPVDSSSEAENASVASVGAEGAPSSQFSVSFSVTPQITVDTDNPQMLDIHWETNIAANSAFFLSESQDGSNPVLQQGFATTSTAFDYQTAKYQTPVFYVITVSEPSTGDTATSTGQLAPNQS